MKENGVGKNIVDDEIKEVEIFKGTKEFKRKINKHNNLILQNKGRNKNLFTLYEKKPKQINILNSYKTVQYDSINNDYNKLYYISHVKNTNKNRNKPEHQRNFNKVIFSSNGSKIQEQEENINHNIYNIDLNKIKKIGLKQSFNMKKTFEINKRESERSLKNEGISSNKNSDQNFITSKSFFFNDKRDLIQKRNKQYSESNYSNNNIIVNNLISEKNNDKKSELSKINNNLILQEKENNINIIGKNKIIESGIHCYICERMYYFPNIYFAKCNIHFFCKNCLRAYYHDLVENGIKRMKCPIYKCKFDIDNIYSKQILDNHCYQILFNNENEEEKKTNMGDIPMPIMLHFKNKQIIRDELYYKQNVIDINSNLDLYYIRKTKDEYCPKCNEHCIFRKTNTFFYKCLNCGFKICKYCNKEFTNFHLDLNDNNHCKVYYRKKKNFISSNIFFNFFFQMLYTVGMFLIFIFFCFFLINKFFLIIFGVHEKKENYLRFIFSLIFSILIYLIIIPFLIILIPFFPNIIALTDD